MLKTLLIPKKWPLATWQGAGTDSNISVVLYGEKSGVRVATDVAKLEAPSHDCFERGKEDHFELVLKDVGRLTELTISNDGRAFNVFKSAWHLHHVQARGRPCLPLPPTSSPSSSFLPLHHAQARGCLV